MTLPTEEIVERLDIVISLLIPPYEEAKYPIKGLALEILQLCDLQNSSTDIVKKLKKPRTAIDNNLSKLRALGLIRSVPKNSGTYHMRLR
jgi:predicted transcriptional regulator